MSSASTSAITCPFFVVTLLTLVLSPKSIVSSLSFDTSIPLTLIGTVYVPLLSVIADVSIATRGTDISNVISSGLFAFSNPLGAISISPSVYTVDISGIITGIPDRLIISLLPSGTTLSTFMSLNE